MEATQLQLCGELNTMVMKFLIKEVGRRMNALRGLDLDELKSLNPGSLELSAKFNFSEPTVTYPDEEEPKEASGATPTALVTMAPGALTPAATGGGGDDDDENTEPFVSPLD